MQVTSMDVDFPPGQLNSIFNTTAGEPDPPCPRRLMQRPPIACRRAVQSLTCPPQRYIWISDELLALTVRNFFRTGCAHQKRHGSHVPGPLEARRRAAKRKMTAQAHVPQGDLLSPLYTLGAFLGGRSQSPPSWRYEPPSVPSTIEPLNTSLELEKPPSAIWKDLDPVHEFEIAKEPSTSESLGIERSAATNSHTLEQPREREHILAARPDPDHLDNELKAIEERLTATEDLDTCLAHFEQWVELANEIDGRLLRLAALRRFCNTRYPVGEKGAHFTLRILQRLNNDHWDAYTITKWLLDPLVPFPSLHVADGTQFLRQLDDMVASAKKSGRHAHWRLHRHIELLYEKAASPVFGEYSTVDKGPLQTLNLETWKNLLCSHRHSMRVKDIKKLRHLGIILTNSAFQTRAHRNGIANGHLLRYVSLLVDSETISATIKDEFLKLIPRSILSTWEEAGPVVQFTHILDRARRACVLRSSYRRESVDMLMDNHAEIIHQIAHHYAVDHTRSHLQGWRTIYNLYNYLVRHNLPIKPLFTKSVVHVCLARPLSENTFISSRRLIWVCELVAKVEGEDAAKRIEHAFWIWRGDLIAQAKKRSDELGGHGKVHVSYLKRLGIL